MKKLLIAAAIFIVAGPAFAQVGVQPAAFNVDFATFKSDSAGYDMLEVYYQIYSSNLLYVRQDKNYMASYRVAAVIKDGHKQVAADEKEEVLYAESYNEAHNAGSYVINVFKFYIEPGRYKVQVTLHDQNGMSSIPLETNLDISEFPSGEQAISHIEFARQIAEIGDPTVFDKKYYRVIPACSRRYGDDLQWLKFYFQFYNYDSTKTTADFTFEVRDHKNKVMGGKVVRYNIGSATGIIDSLNLNELKPGPYELVVFTPDESGKDYITRTGSFTVNWSALELVKHDFDNAVEQLRYIATGAEIKRLKEAAEADRVKEWNAFWRAKDPTPDTDENEIKDEYYRRIAYSNKHYEIPNKDGWRTDMGMINIINGQPDEIERHPFDMDTKPYEIWYYYNPRRRFLFIDVRGYGEYLLQYPFDGDINKNINIFGGGP